MSHNGVSYKQSTAVHDAITDRYINIPYSQHPDTHDSECVHVSETQVYTHGVFCKICSKSKPFKIHDCPFEYSHPLRIYTKEYFISFFKDFKLGVNCEKSVYNYTIQYCKESGIDRLWSVKKFKWNYKHAFIKVKLNLIRNKQLYDSVLDG